MSETPAIKAVVDARGLVCPMPLIKLRQAFMVLKAGDQARLLATDPQAVADVSEFCLAGGHDLIEQREEAGVFGFVVAKAGG